MIIESNDKSKKTTLDDNAAIYKKREEVSTKARFKELQGKERWQFFFDYILGKILGAAAIIGIIIWVLWSVFSPKPEVMMHIGVLDNPLSEESQNILTSTLTDAFVTDSETQTVTLDTDFYVSTDSYNSRTKLITLIGAADLDALIMPEAELVGYSTSGIYEDLSTVVSSELLEASSDRLIYGAELISARNASGDVTEINQVTDKDLDRDLIYAVDVTDYIEKLCGYRPTVRYMMICTVNAPHQENFDKLFEIFNK